MLKNYIKTALRNLRKNPGYSFINIAGLAIGIACCLLINAIVTHEMSYDRFHENLDRLYRLEMTFTGSQGDEERETLFPETLPRKLEDRIEGIDAASGFLKNEMLTVYEGVEYYGNMVQVNQDFLEMFSFPLLAGNPQTALADGNNIVLTKEYAERIFGEGRDYASLVGQSVMFPNPPTQLVDQSYTVTGILQDLPETSSISFDFLVPLSGEPLFEVESNWAGFTTVYLLLGENVQAENIDLVLTSFGESALADLLSNSSSSISEREVRLSLGSFAEVYLDDEFQSHYIAQGNTTSLLIGSIIALVILAIACFNYMIFSLGNSQSRAGEIGIRKVLGAMRSQVARQFWGEVIVQGLIALLLAAILAELLLPIVSVAIGKDIRLFDFGVWHTWAGVIAIILSTGLLAGAYPAFHLSRLSPADVLKKSGNGIKSGLLTRGLIVVQNGICIALLIVAATMTGQLQYMQNRDLGYNSEQVLVLAPNNFEEAEAFKQAVLPLAGIADATVTDRAFTTGSLTYDWTDDSGESFDLRLIRIDPDYLNTLQIDLVAGRDFSHDRPADITGSVLVNQAFVQRMGWSDPIERRIENEYVSHEIIGVVEDFHIDNLHRGIMPLALHINPEYGGGSAQLLVRVHPEAVSNTLENIEAVWADLFGQRTFDYSFLDDRLEGQYAQEALWRKVITFATGIGIAIASMGLLGLVLISVTRRTKEIGIRKVLGATVTEVTTLLSKEFLLLVLIANVIAWPVAWYAMSNWLDNFVYRIELSPGVFLLAGSLALVIALITVSLQSVRAAMANPIESLRSE